jgi:hypothetical protein
VAEAQQRISAREFAEWLAEFSIAPWGEERADYMLAQLTSYFVQANKRKGARDPSPTDFMPWTEQKKIGDPDEMQAYLATVAEQVGAHRRGNRR